MEHDTWRRTVPDAITSDPLWRQQAYRLALFMTSVVWEDTRGLVRARETTGVADQLLRAVGSIGAHIAEGYSRGTPPDRARFYEYALGSARESRHWYYGMQAALGQAIVTPRIDMLTRITRLLLTTLPHTRRQTIRRA